MADWTQAPPYGPPPGATQPPPLASSPGWAPWVTGEAAGAGGGGGANPAITKVTLEVTRGETVEFATEGDTPGPWEKDDVTAETEPGVEPYQDFTRFRRLYPKVTYREYTKVTVKLIIEFANGKTKEEDYTFWEPGGAVHPLTNAYVYVWKQTSRKRIVHGRPMKIYVGTPPTRTGDKPRWPEETWRPTEEPPEQLLGMLWPPKPGGEYAAVMGPEWRDASAETLFAAASLRWVKFAEVKSAAAKGKSARRRG
jgi:hypothetical protein